MRYPQPNDRYDCSVLCSNFMEIEEKFKLQSEEIERVRKSSVMNSGAIMGEADGETIVVTDSANEPPFSIALYGKAKQNTTSGKNLIGNYVANGFVRSSGTYDNESFTITRTQSGGVSYYCRDYQNLEVGKTYTISAKIETAETQGGYIQAMYYLVSESGETSYESIKSVYGNELTITLAKESARVRLLFGMRNSNAEIGASITFTEVQLEENTVATEFEPFTNGATPRPDYQQEIEVSGESYNLIPYPYNGNVSTDRGITWVEENGVITANGTATADATFYLNSSLTLKAGSYILSGCPSGGGSSSYRIQLANNAWSVMFADTGNGTTVTLTEDTTLQQFRILIPSGTTVNNLVFKPMLRKASVKNDRYMPYGVGSVEVKSTGKNLLKNTATSLSKDGVTFTVNSDGSVTANGTSTNNAIIIINDNIIDNLARGKSYKCIDITTCRIDYSNGTSKYMNQFTVEDTMTKIVPYIQIKNGNSVNKTYYPMIVEITETDDTWQPYKETLATITTPNGLAGIKVSEGGNYTDSNGQQWICDEIVKYADGSGVLIQRIEKLTYNGLELGAGWIGTVTANGEKLTQVNLNNTNALFINSKSIMCDKFKVVSWNSSSDSVAYTCRQGSNGACCFYVNESDGITDVATANAWLQENPVTVYYILKEPITTPLTAEQLAEMEKISMFNPVTVVTNDANADMAIEYIADANIYIDNLKAAHDADVRKLTAAIEALGGKVE